MQKTNDSAGAGGSRVVKAWKGGNADGYEDIVFAATRNDARSKIASRFDLSYMEVCDLRRVPELDDFDGNLRRWQLDNGWFFDCSECGKRTYGRDESSSEDFEEPVLGDDEHVFCSMNCCRKHSAYWGAIRAKDDAVAGDFLRRYPGVPLLRVWHNEYGSYAQAGEPLSKVITMWEFHGCVRRFGATQRVLDVNT